MIDPRMSVSTRGGQRRIAVHDVGEGPPLLLLHGFPSWSGDWVSVASAVAGGHRSVMFDFLGFGYSDKPADHEYSILEQADIAEAVCGSLGIDSAVVVAHDYGTAVAQELLARSSSGTGSLDVSAVLFTNGAVYPDLHRRTPVQDLLLSEAGAEIAAAIDHDAFVDGVRATFSDAHPPSDKVLDDMWDSMANGGGNLLAHKLMHYVGDRAEHGDRWVAAMEGAGVPLAFVWGMLDSVSGAHVHARIVSRLPDAHVVALPTVGHWVPIEDPAAIVAGLGALTSD